MCQCGDADTGNDDGGNLTNVTLSTCLHDAADQHWQYIRSVPTISQGSGQNEHPNTLKTLGRCLDIKGNGTAAGTQVELYDCSSVGGQQRVPQPNGTLLNPRSGLCLTSPGGSTADGTVLDIETCTGGANQQFVHQNAAALAHGTTVSLRSTTPCCTSSWVRHQGGTALLSPISASGTTGTKADASWTVRPGLSNTTCLSFESRNFPNGYLRRENRTVLQQQNDGTTQFASDATFCPQPGKNGQGISLSAVGDSTLFLRHYSGQVHLASNGGSNAWDTTTSWNDDVSWRPTPAWTP